MLGPVLVSLSALYTTFHPLSMVSIVPVKPSHSMIDVFQATQAIKNRNIFPPEIPNLILYISWQERVQEQAEWHQLLNKLNKRLTVRCNSSTITIFDVMS